MPRRHFHNDRRRDRLASRGDGQLGLQLGDEALGTVEKPPSFAAVFDGQCGLLAAFGAPAVVYGCYARRLPLATAALRAGAGRYRAPDASARSEGGHARAMIPASLCSPSALRLCGSRESAKSRGLRELLCHC